MRVIIKEKIEIPTLSDIKEAYEHYYEAFNSNKKALIYPVKGMKKDDSYNKEIRKILELSDKYKCSCTIYTNKKETAEKVRKLIKLLTPKSIKIGIAFSGGGGRGSYQIGTIKTLDKLGIINSADVLVGTSIGALNLIGYYSIGLDAIEDKWRNMDTSIMLSKNDIKERIKKVAVYSREKTIDYLSTIVKEDEFKITFPKLFINTVSVKTFHPKYININNKDKDYIINAMLASSSIPFIYGIGKIENEIVVDGGFISNHAIDLLIKERCNVIFVASLCKENCIRKSIPGVSIIDFSSPVFYPGVLKGTLLFDKNNDEKIQHGEDISSLLIKKLDDMKQLKIILNKDQNKFYMLNEYIRIEKEENPYTIEI